MTASPPNPTLERLFRPRSIAILGASADPAKITGRPLRFLLDKGYAGRIFPVNPKYGTLAGLVCYRSLADVPEPPDLVIVAVPAPGVPQAIAQCAARGAGAAVVFSSGFGEMGEEGRRLERELVAAAKRGGVRLCGPNTLGFMNSHDRVMATFSQAGDGDTPPGPVAFVTQSGAFGTALFALARQRGLAFGYFVNSGNEADLGFGDLLEWVVADDRVRVVAGYIEGLRDGQRLLEVADRALDLGKPIAIAKVGRSAAGARAAASHTGSLAGSDRVYSDVFRQHGIVRVGNEESLLDLAAAFSLCPSPAGRRLGLVTQSGGAGVLMADRAEELGLAVPELSAATQARLREVVPAFGGVKNPVDITAQFIGDPGLLRAALEIVLGDSAIDAAIFYFGLMDRFADQVVDNLRAVHAGTPKPLIVAWVAAPEAGLRALRDAGICVLPTATRAVDAMHGLVRFAEGCARRKAERASVVGQAPGATLRAEPRAGLPRPASQGAPASAEALRAAVDSARADGRRALGSIEAFDLLAGYGIAAPRVRLATTAEEAAAAVAALGTACALKLESPDIVHKSEVDGVRLGVATPEAARAAFVEILTAARPRAPGARIRGVLVQEMAPAGTEAVLGVRRDPQFGPLVMVGLGGIFIEVLEDVAFAAAPVTRAAAEVMIGSLRGARVLEGVRGRPPGDLPALIEAVLGMSRLAIDGAGFIEEMDVNPLLVLPRGQGVRALDALMVLARQAGAAR
jgi:acyl-CoA synthetase (NDP forming)